MRRPEFIARQAAHPKGLIGRVIARIMALETATPNRRALELLGIDKNSRVLEVGFGHGYTLGRAAELAPRGFVAGIGNLFINPFSRVPRLNCRGGITEGAIGRRCPA